jgi:hypothetical protein
MVEIFWQHYSCFQISNYKCWRFYRMFVALAVGEELSPHTFVSRMFVKSVPHKNSTQRQLSFSSAWAWHSAACSQHKCVGRGYEWSMYIDFESCQWRHDSGRTIASFSMSCTIQLCSLHIHYLSIFYFTNTCENAAKKEMILCRLPNTACARVCKLLCANYWWPY